MISYFKLIKGDVVLMGKEKQENGDEVNKSIIDEEEHRIISYVHDKRQLKFEK